MGRTRRTALFFAALVAAGVLPCASARAATATGALPVSVSVSDSCSVATLGGVAFSGYTPGTSSDTSGSFSVGCTNGASVSSITIDNGQNASAGQRFMKASSATLPYNLYSDAARSTVWSGGASPPSATYTADGTSKPFTVYARIPSGATPVAGTYNDVVTITINYT